MPKLTTLNGAQMRLAAWSSGDWSSRIWIDPDPLHL